MERAGECGGAVGEVGVEGPLQRVHPFGHKRRGIGNRGETGVEGEGTDSVGVTVGVAGPDAGAVRDAEEGDGLLTERLAQLLHVADDVLGAQVGKQITAIGRAGVREGLPSGQPGIELGLIVGRRVNGVVRLVVRLAVDLATFTDAARIEADEVELSQDLLREDQPAQLVQNRDRGTARAAAIHKQRADPLIGIAGR